MRLHTIFLTVCLAASTLHAADELKIQVAGSVPPGATLEVFTTDGQKIPVSVQNGAFRGTAVLRDRITEIKARTTINGSAREIRTRTIWVKNSHKRFRCYIDAHSFFFRDILKKDYGSIFDCFYLGRLHELHRNFGARINLNCFNTTPERDFELSMFPDKYKSGFEDNAHWLRLAFHSENEFPAIPYLNATPEQVIPLGKGGKILVDLAGLPRGDHLLKAVVRHREIQEPVLQADYPITIVDLPTVDRSNIRRLNNLVAEVLNEPIQNDSTGQSFKFVNPRDGWVFVAFTTDTPAARATIGNYSDALRLLDNPENRLVYTWVVGKPSISSLHTDFISTCLNASRGRGRLLFEAYWRF